VFSPTLGLCSHKEEDWNRPHSVYMHMLVEHENVSVTESDSEYTSAPFINKYIYMSLAHEIYSSVCVMGRPNLSNFP
jgi:hypothetical protein